jgi:hypothetical protein
LKNQSFLWEAGKSLESIDFNQMFSYDTLKVGITVPVILSFFDKFTKIEAKVDTGSSFCVFERIHGENIGLEIESGFRETFSTVTAPFVAYGHEITLSVLGIETTSTVYFAESEYFTRNVLGRQGWLDRIKLGLIDNEGKLFLNEL